MDPAKRKRLEEAGWHVGTVAEFLGLTEEESIYLELRVLLTKALKARRQAARLSQKALATAIQSSQSRIAKAEANNHTVSVDLLVRSLIALGVTLEELGRILVANQKRPPARRRPPRQTPQPKETKQSVKRLKKNGINAA